jgi:hypothetical protein
MLCGIFEGGNADTLTHCFEVLSVRFGILESGNGNEMAAQAQWGKVPKVWFLFLSMCKAAFVQAPSGTAAVPLTRLPS